ncbi:MAG: MarR family transcriptional regulator [Verrucomicrobia bacterium]|nr:MAG: MarR family transcriptional regulator [Verrucomicrobiota bacterium]
MKTTILDCPEKSDAERLADFVMFTQPRCVLNLSAQLIKGHISIVQFFLLAYLANAEFLTMSDIAKKMGHSTAAATGQVDRLESLLYVKRVHADDDRRKILVRITRSGDELVASMHKEIANDLVSVLADMNAHA